MKLITGKPQPRLPFDAPDAQVVFVRHRRARRFILRVLPDGTLRVTLPRWGAKREAEAFVKQSRDWIEKQQRLRREQPVRPASAADLVAQRQLRARAAEELPPLVFAHAAELGITVTRVTVRNQQSRWGSCSRRGAITLNWRLVQMPPFVRDYIVIHELMHRREMNHSPRFWRHVASACPRHQEARTWLRTEGKKLL
jgi:predicted metal-dependent hydrolase